MTRDELEREMADVRYGRSQGGATREVAVSVEKVIDLDAIRALEAAATPGPWWVTEDLDPNDDESAIGVAAGSPVDPDGMVVVTPGSGSFDIGIGLDWRLPNAEFVAAARTAIPDLLALLDEALAAGRALDVAWTRYVRARRDGGPDRIRRVWEEVEAAKVRLARFPAPSPTDGGD